MRNELGLLVVGGKLVIDQLPKSAIADDVAKTEVAMRCSRPVDLCAQLFLIRQTHTHTQPPSARSSSRAQRGGWLVPKFGHPGVVCDLCRELCRRRTPSWGFPRGEMETVALTPARSGDSPQGRNKAVEECTTTAA
jgi:hypothetical protein